MLPDLPIKLPEKIRRLPEAPKNVKITRKLPEKKSERLRERVKNASWSWANGGVGIPTREKWNHSSKRAQPAFGYKMYGKKSFTCAFVFVAIKSCNKKHMPKKKGITNIANNRHRLVPAQS